MDQIGEAETEGYGEKTPTNRRFLTRARRSKRMFFLRGSLMAFSTANRS